MTGNNINWTDAVTAWERLQTDQDTTTALIQDDWRAIGKALIPIREKYADDQSFGKQRAEMLPELKSPEASDAMRVGAWADAEWRKVLSVSEATTPRGLVMAYGKEVSKSSKPTPTKPKGEKKKGYLAQITSRCPAPKGVLNFNHWLADNKKEFFAYIGHTIPTNITDADAIVYAEQCSVWLASRGETGVVEEAKKDLPPSAKEKVERAVNRSVALENSRLQAEYKGLLEEAIAERVAELNDRANRLTKAERKLAKREKMLREWAAREAGKGNTDSVVLVLTVKEYKTLVGVLHPDRFPEEYREKMGQAAAMVNAGLH